MPLLRCLIGAGSTIAFANTMSSPRPGVAPSRPPWANHTARAGAILSTTEPQTARRAALAKSATGSWRRWVVPPDLEEEAGRRLWISRLRVTGVWDDADVGRDAGARTVVADVRSLVADAADCALEVP